MAAVVVVEAVAIALLTLLVAGLLRSHAEMLRALHRLGVDVAVGEDQQTGHAGPASHGHAPRLLSIGDRPGGQRGGQAAADISGVTVQGEAIQVGMAPAEQPTLVAFLSSGCGTCGPLWQAMSDAMTSGLFKEGLRVVVVTRSPEEESVSALRSMMPKGALVVLSSQAWADYSVPGSPYFAYVAAGSSIVQGEGTGRSWEQVADLLSRAEADATPAGAGGGGRQREAHVDAELMAAGVWPGHRSLYPKGLPGEQRGQQRS